MGKFSRRDFLWWGATAAAALALATKGIFANSADDPTPTPELPITPTEQPMPFIPQAERINPEVAIPEDVLSGVDLWRSYHTRVWCGEETKLFLRPGIEEVPIFSDLRDRKIESLDIVLFDDICDLTQEQRDNLDPGLVSAFDEFVAKEGFPTGLFLGYGGHFGIFIAKSSMQQHSEHLLENHPSADSDWVATYHTPAIILRHEWSHYNYINFSSSPEEAVGADILAEMRRAQKKLEGGDDSGYCVVYEIKEGVVVS